MKKLFKKNIDDSKNNRIANLLIVISFLLILGFVFPNITILSYFDELLGLFAIVYILLRGKINKNDMIIVISILLIIFSGLYSNIKFGLVSSKFPIFVDVISSIKVLSVFIAAKYIFNEDIKNTFITKTYKLSILYIIIAILCYAISFFMDIGMSSQIRYGLFTYIFIFDKAFQLQTVSMMFYYIVVEFHRINNIKIPFILNLLYIILILSCLKGPAILFVLFYYGFLGMSKVNKVIRVLLLSLIIILSIFISSFQIKNYLMNQSSARYILTKYSFVTANNYFPFGSGFATYGSDMAAKNYSPLYIEYGFNHYYGMNIYDHAFLNDNFWQMCVAQFGWIFGLLYICAFYSIINNKRNIKDFKENAFFKAMLLQYLIHGIGSAILSDRAGVLGFLILGMMAANGLKKEVDSYGR